MHAITTPTAITPGAGRHPSSILIRTPTTISNNSVAPPRVRFAKDLPVARSPVLDEDQMVVTIPMAGRAQTPIRRRIKVAYKEVRIRPSALKRVWSATFGRFEREEKVNFGADNSSVFVCQTPDRLTVLRSPPPVRRNVQEEDVSEEMKEEFAAWVNARIVTARLNSL